MSSEALARAQCVCVYAWLFPSLWSAAFSPPTSLGRELAAPASLFPLMAMRLTSIAPTALSALSPSATPFLKLADTLVNIFDRDTSVEGSARFAEPIETTRRRRSPRRKHRCRRALCSFKTSPLARDISRTKFFRARSIQWRDVTPGRPEGATAEKAVPSPTSRLWTGTHSSQESQMAGDSRQGIPHPLSLAGRIHSRAQTFTHRHRMPGST